VSYFADYLLCQVLYHLISMNLEIQIWICNQITFRFDPIWFWFPASWFDLGILKIYRIWLEVCCFVIGFTFT